MATTGAKTWLWGSQRWTKDRVAPAGSLQHEYIVFDTSEKGTKTKTSSLLDLTLLLFVIWFVQHTVSIPPSTFLDPVVWASVLVEGESM